MSNAHTQILRMFLEQLSVLPSSGHLDSQLIIPHLFSRVFNGHVLIKTSPLEDQASVCYNTGCFRLLTTVLYLQTRDIHDILYLRYSRYPLHAQLTGRGSLSSSRLAAARISKHCLAVLTNLAVSHEHDSLFS